MSDKIPPPPVPPGLEDLVPKGSDFLYESPTHPQTSAWTEAHVAITLVDGMIQHDIPDFNPHN